MSEVIDIRRTLGEPENNAAAKGAMTYPPVCFSPTLVVHGNELRGTASRLAILLSRARDDGRSLTLSGMAKVLDVSQRTLGNALWGRLLQSDLVEQNNGGWRASDLLMSVWEGADRPRQNGVPSNGPSCLACAGVIADGSEFCPACGVGRDQEGARPLG